MPQIKVYISGITVRQARILRHMIGVCGGCRCNVIRLDGAARATWDCDMDGPRAVSFMRLILTPPPRWAWATRQCMVTYSP